VATGVMSPPRVYRNNQTKNYSLLVALEDFQGNRFCVGCKVVIHYQEQGEKKQQIREMKLSGGYLSFHEPVLHFGLGQVANVEQLEVHWSDGTQQRLQGPFAGGYRYRITRPAKSHP